MLPLVVNKLSRSITAKATKRKTQGSDAAVHPCQSWQHVFERSGFYRLNKSELFHRHILCRCHHAADAHVVSYIDFAALTFFSSTSSSIGSFSSGRNPRCAPWVNNVVHVAHHLENNPLRFRLFTQMVAMNDVKVIALKNVLLVVPGHP